MEEIPFLVVIAVADAHPAGVTPDARSQKQEARPAVGGQILSREVIGRRSPIFIRLWNNCGKPLIDRPPATMLISIAHHLGDL